MKKIFNKIRKDNFFWYLLIPLLVLLTLFISLSPWLAELLATPPNQVFTGINRWSTDYYIYLSYVEQGVRGFLSTKLIFTTQIHSSIFFFLAYTIPGYVFGHILGFNSIFIYHLFRTLYGLVFLLMTVFFFYKLSQSKTITLAAFILTFYVSGFVKITSFFPFQATRYLEWLQEQNIISRATGPLHYSVGFIIFIATFLYYFYTNDSSAKKVVIFGLLLNGLLLSNPFTFLLITLSFVVYLLIKLVFYKKNPQFYKEIIIITAGFIISLPLFLVLNYYLSSPPWGIVGVSPKFYVKTTPPVSLWEVALSVGPIFFLGIFGTIGLLNEQFCRQTNVIPTPDRSRGQAPAGIQEHLDPLLREDDKRSSSALIFLIVWPIIQLFLLIFGDSFKIHPPRAFSGLYYLPLAYFSASFIIYLSKRIGTSMHLPAGRQGRYIAVLIIFILFFITLPNYYLSYKEQLFAFTDFKYFSPFIYPTKNQVKAFQFLEKNSPPYSGVLALFEASSLINGFSGNSTEVGMDQNLKMPFYTNKLNIYEAGKFLEKYHFRYVYFGYQEKFTGGNMDKYPFLKKIFKNEEVTIYQIL